MGGFDRAGNDTRQYKDASAILRNILAQSGGKEGALETLAALRAAKFKNYAVTITEKSDYTNGVLNTDRVYQQFLARVGGFADDMSGMQAAFEASIAGAGLGESRDVSLTYNVGYEYSAARSHEVADQSSSKIPFVGGLQRTGTLIGLGVEGLAPGDFASGYSIELALDAALTAAGGVSIYRGAANLLRGAAAKVPSSGVRVGLEFEEGFSPTEFNRKLTRLDTAVKRGEAVASRPVSMSAAERRALTRAYRADLEARIRSFYKDQPASMERALQRLRKSDIDHILDIQLGGQNVRGNLKTLHSATNQGLGRQVQHQLPVGDPVPIEEIYVKP